MVLKFHGFTCNFFEWKLTRIQRRVIEIRNWDTKLHQSLFFYRFIYTYTQAPQLCWWGKLHNEPATWWFNALHPNWKTVALEKKFLHTCLSYEIIFLWFWFLSGIFIFIYLKTTNKILSVLLLVLIFSRLMCKQFYIVVLNATISCLEINCGFCCCLRFFWTEGSYSYSKYVLEHI